MSRRRCAVCAALFLLASLLPSVCGRRPRHAAHHSARDASWSIPEPDKADAAWHISSGTGGALGAPAQLSSHDSGTARPALPAADLPLARWPEPGSNGLPPGAGPIVLAAAPPSVRRAGISTPSQAGAAGSSAAPLLWAEPQLPAIEQPPSAGVQLRPLQPLLEPQVLGHQQQGEEEFSGDLFYGWQHPDQTQAGGEPGSLAGAEQQAQQRAQQRRTALSQPKKTPRAGADELAESEEWGERMFHAWLHPGGEPEADESTVEDAAPPLLQPQQPRTGSGGLEQRRAAESKDDVPAGQAVQERPEQTEQQQQQQQKPQGGDSGEQPEADGRDPGKQHPEPVGSEQQQQQQQQEQQGQQLEGPGEGAGPQDRGQLSEEPPPARRALVVGPFPHAPPITMPDWRLPEEVGEPDEQQQEQQEPWQWAGRYGGGSHRSSSKKAARADCHPELQALKCPSRVSGSEAFAPAAAVTYWQRWMDACCAGWPQQPAPAPRLPGAAAQLVPLAADRPDLTAAGVLGLGAGAAPDLQLGTCNARQAVIVPRFETSKGGPMDLQTLTRVTYSRELVPHELPASVIRSVKRHVLSRLHDLDPATRQVAGNPVRELADRISTRSGASGFVHPGGTLGPAELALALVRLRNSSALQQAALHTLLTGEGVPAKTYSSHNPWHPPTDTPRDLTSPEYTGPLPMAEVAARYNGQEDAQHPVPCHARYPAGAPRELCAHISLVEMDGQGSYKQALAYWATGDEAYARNALSIIHAWATTNKAFGLVSENGPLEAGWAVASFAKALELLRGVDGWQQAYDAFVAWVDALLMPEMDWYIYNISAPAIMRGEAHVYGNWHATVAEAWMAVAVLTDDRPRFDLAVRVFRETVADYFKWGRGPWADNRYIGECSETLRDVFHSEFGFGGLLQVAEMAWQQDLDLYSASGYALLAGLELHARIINAWNASDPGRLPPGFRFADALPKLPSGAKWHFNIRQQVWLAQDEASGEVLARLDDGYKYLVGVVFLPTGWELAYNHFAGRLGLAMPETAALLAREAPDYYCFHWGSTTLTHADSATPLWRAGLQPYLVCGDPADKLAMLRGALQQDTRARRQRQHAAQR